MEKSKGMQPVKMVVIIAIGAALYGVGGLLSVPVFANTTIKPAMAILALVAGLYGPIVGFLVGFLGHWLTDMFAGWGVWPTWMLGSGIVGAVIGLFPILTKRALDTGFFSKGQIGLYILLAFVGNFFGYLISAVLDFLLFAEPLDKVITQQLIIAISNTIVIGILGTLLMLLVAKRNKDNTNLTADTTK
ncbi:ECF-type riboflavin transporter substrate-binding protein [Sphaerochaeta sp. PS]|uniref:ECF-type riboflavin transporter substrate-binding protein n=1 Tax=Sphaerochaeta sp. PS TaxID=3076336 RepID=UPI0028A512F1|nr:ECF-type riboflavin transporter substrate-binding protein [Sphaerochaeta sp. PS]MDT4761962.1 ECF-type riboflavin transporter substrate-binding protein [Sphaerochaeta sp. PS]